MEPVAFLKTNVTGSQRPRASRVQHGWTPLYYAAACGHLDVVRALLNAGADKPIADNDGKKPIDYARKNGHDAIVALLR